MTLTTADVLAALDRIGPLAKAAGWDPVGLQVGDPAAEVTRLGLCHDVTAAVIDEAVARSVDLLVAYHPLIFRPLPRLVAGSGSSGLAYRLAASGIGLAVPHTAFDVASGGAADALAESLGLADVTGFGPVWGAETDKVVVFVPPDAVEAVSTAMSAAGAGRIGAYTGCSFRSPGVGTFHPEDGAQPMIGEVGKLNTADEVRVEMVTPAARVDDVVAALVAAHPYEEPAYDVISIRGNAGMIGRIGHLAAPRPIDDFAASVGEALGGVVRHTEAAGPVERVAVIPGSGAGYVGTVAGKADVLVTGDVKHHDARSAMAASLAVVDPGHAATERPGLATLYAALSEVAAVVDLTGIDPSPWKEH